MNASTTELPTYYGGIHTHVCDESLSVDLEVARWLAIQEKRLGYRPTTLFRNVMEYPDSLVLGNPYPRQVVLSALELTPENCLEKIWCRLQGATPQVSFASEPWKDLSGLDALPILRHRPRDGGRYVTAGVAVTRSPSSNRLNLGVYRIQVVSATKARIFFDPKTDAYSNWQECLQEGRHLPIAIFLGADPVYILTAASRLRTDQDDFRIAARLRGKGLRLAGEPPVPVESSYVIWGEVTDQLELEGPFAEFKGYYVDARLSPVLQVHRVAIGPDPLYPVIVTGAESGLTLMAFQNEYLMYSHLRSEGYNVRGVRYCLEGFGEFVAVIESDEPSIALLGSAMDFDRRCKLMICGSHVDRPWASVATHGFQVVRAPYFRKGKPEGDRVGLILDQPPSGQPIEY